MFNRDIFSDLSVNFCHLKFNLGTFENSQTVLTVKQSGFFANRLYAFQDCKFCTFYNKYIPVVKWNAYP